MIEEQIKQLIKKVIQGLGVDNINFSIEHPENMEHGDYACNVALVAGGGRKLAEKIVIKLKQNKELMKIVEKIKVEGPGFINISVQSGQVIKQVDRLLNNISKSIKSDNPWGKKVMVEYAHPNTHKQFHIGHLRNICLGESICRLLEFTGVKVIRVNYQGDVGLHIAKALWAIKKQLSDYQQVKKASIFKRIEFLSKAYAKGSQAYEKDQKAKKEIIKINKQIFDKDKKIIDLWQETRKWSLKYFDLIYQRVGVSYDKLYFESQCTDGADIALKALEKEVLSKSKGAIVFKGEKYGLDTRVFINSQGLPTYEAKELSLAKKQFSDFGDLDKNIHVVGPEQISFFKVTFKVEELLNPQKYKGKQYHKVYGLVDLKGGKMSSRKGQVVSGWWLLNQAKQKIKGEYQVSDQLAEEIGAGAVKYGFLKVQSKSKIAFDLNESVTLEGNSGPYLQYTYARCNSVLQKAKFFNKGPTFVKKFKGPTLELLKEEDELLRTLYQFEEVVIKSAKELSPNLVANYLYLLAQKFNSFYNKHQILKAKENKEIRLWLTKATGEIIKKGLDLLGIEAPEKM